MIGGLATICPECSYRWTLSPMVSISWYCPECGSGRSGEACLNLCVCGHVYERHHTKQNVKPSRAAFGISVNEFDKLDGVLATKPEPAPKIGRCTACPCKCFKLDPPRLSTTKFLHKVFVAADQGARGRETKVTKIADGIICLSKGTRSIRLSIHSDDSILMEALDVEQPKLRIVRMGRDTIGKTVIAIHKILRAR